ncbi:hypothetical protein HBZS_111660 [Helicobacter bizzozeronii CCUG 35545]|nr:hypothetical protein HBZS_111660 [Helicobacter bizzozeronii CCUG 35545]
MPQEGEEVFYDHSGKQHSTSLVQMLSQGGEGIIYTTNTPMLAKIYGHKHKSVQTGGVPDYTPKKLALLVKIKVSKQVCMPSCLLKKPTRRMRGLFDAQSRGQNLTTHFRGL